MVRQQHDGDAVFASKYFPMKQLIYIVLCCALTGALVAQPVLPITVEPGAGAVLNAAGWYPPSFFDPGPAGENQTWDFSAVGPGDVWVTRSYLDPAGTPFAAKFPAATLCMRTDAGGLTPPSFTYYAETDSTVSTLGLGILGANVIVNTTPWDRQYPMYYGEIQTDTISGTNTNNGQSVFFDLFYTRDYDGFGVLMMPGGQNYQNAIRVKTTANRRDSVPGFNNTHTLRLGTQEFYYWYVPTISGFLFWTSKYQEVQLKINANGDTTQITSGTPVYAVEYQTSLPVPTAEPQVAGDFFEILGNPAQEWLKIRLKHPASEPAEVLICDMAGKVLYQTRNLVSDEILSIPVGNLPPGIYSAQVIVSGRPRALLWEKG